jgi:hypothetical protein
LTRGAWRREQDRISVVTGSRSFDRRWYQENQPLTTPTSAGTFRQKVDARRRVSPPPHKKCTILWGTEIHGDGDTTMRFIALLAFMLFAASPVQAAPEFGSKAEAVAMVRRVQEMFKKDGPQATFKAVSDKSNKEFQDRDLYPFIYDLKGICVAHGARPALIGKNLIGLKDQDGKYLIQEMVKIAEGSGNGWVDYKWPNPITNKIEDKSSYIEKMGNYFVGVGIYRQ